MSRSKIIFVFLASLLIQWATAESKDIDYQLDSLFMPTCKPNGYFNVRDRKIPTSQFFLAQKTISPSFYLSPSHYLNTIGWSCKQELKWEKATSLPLRIRLGSQDQADWLDGKRKFAPQVP